MNYSRRTAKIARYYERVANGAMGAPVSIQVALTDSCFNRCIGCGHPERVQTKMDVDEWLNFLRFVQTEHGVESVCYSGGDPMAFTGFNEVMAAHVAWGLPFGMTITGYVPPTIDLKLMAKADWVRVSLDAVTPEVYAKARGKTPVAKVLDGIERMQAAGVKLGLGITLNPVSEGDYEHVLAYARARGITDIDARYAYPQSNPMWPDLDLESRGVQKFNNCHAVFYQLYIDSDGSVFPCCVTAGDTRDTPQSAALGNIFVEEWAAIWARVIEYSEIELAKLPVICRTCCVQRLSEINHVCGQMPSGKSFF